MELHSYAKTRGPKKWTLELKRKLVQNRIALDAIFNKKHFNLVDSWKTLMKVSSFESFDLVFIKKQWNNVIAKYKILADRHIHGSDTELSEKKLDMITAEWEFFDKIYHWIKLNKKSYHYTTSNLDDECENSKNLLTRTSLSDSDIGEQMITERINETEQPKHLPNNSSNNQHFPSSSHQQQNVNNTENQCQSNKVKQNCSDISVQQNNAKPKKDSLNKQKNVNGDSHCSKFKLIKKIRKIQTKKRIKRYKRNLKAIKKIDKKINSFCEIFAQIVHKEYPDINVSGLLSDTDESNESISSTD